VVLSVIPLKTLRNDYIMNKRLWKVTFLTLILILLSLGLTNPSSAASSSNIQLVVVWETFWGGLEDNSPRSFIQTLDGGFAMITATPNLSTNDEILMLVKFTANGLQEWNLTLAGGHLVQTAGGHLVQTADEEYVISGGTGDFFKNADIWLFKMNTTGHLLWNRTFGGETTEWANSIIQTSDGGFILAGCTNYNFSEDTYDMGVIKTDPLGIPEWNRTFEGDPISLAFSVVETPDGGYAIAGSTEDDMWLVKTDPNGQEEWNRTFGGQESDYARALIQIADGSFLLAGRTTSFTSDASRDYWLLKTDANGQPWYYRLRFWL
jgi:hypothetical protein